MLQRVRKQNILKNSLLFLCDIYNEKVFPSSSDEEDLRADQLLLKDKWRNIFDQFDPEGFGEIPWSELLIVIHQEEFISQVPPEKIESLLDLAYRCV